MPTDPKPTEPQPTDGAGLGLDLFGKPITVADVETAKPALDDDGDQPGQNQDAGLTLTGDEWADIEEAWDERAKQRDAERDAAQE